LDVLDQIDRKGRELDLVGVAVRERQRVRGKMPKRAQAARFI
jgi:hypothetical protein